MKRKRVNDCTGNINSHWIIYIIISVSGIHAQELVSLKFSHDVSVSTLIMVYLITLRLIFVWILCVSVRLYCAA